MGPAFAKRSVRYRLAACAWASTVTEKCKREGLAMAITRAGKFRRFGLVALAAMAAISRRDSARDRAASPCCGRRFGHAGLDSRAGARGVRRAGGVRPAAGPGDPQATPRADRGDTPGTEARGGRRPVDPRLLGLGRRPERLPLDQRHLARPCRRAGSGCRATGPRPTKASSGSPASGCPWTSRASRRPGRSSTCQPRRRASRRGRTSRPRPTT